MRHCFIYMHTTCTGMSDMVGPNPPPPGTGLFFYRRFNLKFILDIVIHASINLLVQSNLNAQNQHCPVEQYCVAVEIKSR